MEPRRPRAATYDELRALPEHLVGELIDGALHAHPRPPIQHAASRSNLGADVNGRFGRSRPPGGWWILDEPELHLGRNVLVPDVAGWRRERLPALPNEAHFTLPPDWVLEVLSPRAASHDRITKANLYARAGVGFLWLLSPLEATLETYRLVDGLWVRTGAFTRGQPVCAMPFEAEVFDGDDWFSQPSPTE